MAAAGAEVGRWCRVLSATVAAAALGLAACDGGGPPQRSAQPAVAAASPGDGETSLLGMFARGNDGPELAEADRQQVRAAEARAYAAAAGQPVHWQNPRSGIFGEIVPVGGAQRQGDRVCREFRHMIMVSGRSFEARGPACERAATAAAPRG